MPATARDVDTPVGTARTLTEGPAGVPVLVLGHGAGGGVEAPDLVAARDAGLAAGLRVVRVEQPWRVRGRRVDPAAGAVPEQQDGHAGRPFGQRAGRPDGRVDVTRGSRHVSKGRSAPCVPLTRSR